MRAGIKRGITGIVLAASTLLAASACAIAPGTDGNIVNEWSAMAAPEGWLPQAETCHKEFAATSHRRSYSPVSCATDHRYQTVFLGEFTGEAAQLPSAPSAAGGPELLAAYKDCDAKTTAFLGGDWRSGRLWIGVSVPSTGAWEGGARWYRCEVAPKEDIFNPGPVTLSKSLKNEFGASSDLKYGCYTIPEDRTRWTAMACTAAHNAEFVAAIPVNFAYADLATDAAADSIHGKCRSAIAAYVGVPDNADMKYRTGTYYRFPGENDWIAGDRQIRCHLWMSKKTLNRSLKGTGNAGLPIR